MPLFRVHQIEKGLDVFAVCEARYGFGFREAGASRIAPTPLGEKGVPNFDALLVRLAAVGIAPDKKLLIAAAFQHPRAESLEIDAEKPAQTVIERPVTGDDPDVVALRKLPGGSQSDFVDDTAENDEPTGLVARTADGKAHEAARLIAAPLPAIADLRSGLKRSFDNAVPVA